MTDFVLKQDNLVRKQKIDSIFFTMNVTDYALFLKQPLTLSMFIPTDSEGNVLENPQNYDIWLMLHKSKGSTIGFTGHEIYKGAKEKVLFKGFSVCNRQSELICLIYNNEHYLLTNLLKGTLEDLVKFNLELSDAVYF